MCENFPQIAGISLAFDRKKTCADEKRVDEDGICWIRWHEKFAFVADKPQKLINLRKFSLNSTEECFQLLISAKSIIKLYSEKLFHSLHASVLISPYGFD